jgi:hypothetical protein
MYDEMHLKFGTKEEDEIPHPFFFLTNFGGLKNHVTDLDVD